MFEDLVCNKYFVIALIAIIIILLFLYIRKRSCGFEGMENIDAQNLDIENAWDGNNVSKYRRKHHLNYGLQSKDEVYRQYMNFNKGNNGNTPKKMKYTAKPIDNRPDLGNCVPCEPCVCPGDLDHHDFFDSESTDKNDYGYPKREVIRRAMKTRSG